MQVGKIFRETNFQKTGIGSLFFLNCQFLSVELQARRDELRL